MNINRPAAIEYARRYWETACDDGVFWLSNKEVVVDRKRKELKAPVSEGWVVRFIPDGKGAEKAVFWRLNRGVIETKLIQPWEGLADCAHFLSKCLQAGGIGIYELSVPKMVDKLQKRPDTKTLAEKVSKERGQVIVNSGIFKIGDMIGYFNIDPEGDYGGARDYSHSTMYAGKLSDPKDEGHITCHTKSRFPGLSHVPDVWYLNDGYLYTLIHFAGDDPKPDKAMVDLLAGWWKVKYGVKLWYYYIFKDGRATYTVTAPTANRELSASPDSAYWFQDQHRVTFTWKKSGSLEVWTLVNGQKEFRLQGDNNSPGTATKMF